MEPSTTTGRKGSLANPEVREDVPGHVIPILEREFDDFDNEAEKYLGGGTPENEFIGFRLKQGVYGQRQADVQMVRVKLPFGGINPEQMEAFADAVEKYVPLRKGNITTSFDGTPEDRAISEIHDIAFRAKVKDGKKGFEMLVGGGTSIMPRTAPVLYDFVEADNGEYLEAAEAVLRIFDRQDWLRPNRARARIKVFVDKFGIEELRRQADEERKGDWVSERDFDVARLRFDHDEEAVVTKLPMLQDYTEPN